MINGLGRAWCGHACSLMSFLSRQRVNLISFLLQSVIVIMVDWRLQTGLMADITGPLVVSGNIDTGQVSSASNVLGQGWRLAGWNAWNGEVLLEFQNKHCQVDT